MSEFVPTMKYYIPTSEEEKNKRISEEQHGIEYAKSKILTYKREAYKKIFLDDIEMRTKEIEYIKEDHFKKLHAIRREYEEFLLSRVNK